MNITNENKMKQLEFKGTKGEWKIGLQNYIKVNEEDPKNTSLICLMQGYNTEETKANAKLIAAAPELLKALIKSVESMKLADEVEFRDEIKQATEAINKALK